MAAQYSEAKRQLLDRYLRGELGVRPSAPAIPRRNPGQTIPLSYAQEQVWLHAQLAPEVPLYNEPVTIHYSGDLNVAALEKSFNEILRRHEAWRTSFTVVDGQPVQEVRPHLSISLPVLDLRGLPKEQRESAASRIATEDARKPLDLAQVPLFRLRLIRLEDQEYRLYLTLSHIIFDGVAIYRVFLPELSTLYKAYSCGQISPLPELTIQYPDYACWQRQSMSRETLGKEVEFWRERLSGSLPETYLPADRPHTRSQSFCGSMYPFKLNSGLTTAVRSFCRTEGVSLFHVLLAGFAALLYRYSGEERIPIGTVTAGRSQPETEALLGYFLNTVVLPVDLSGDPSFREMVKRARNLTIDALEHDRLPFAHLVKELKVQRDPGRNPLFQALFSLEPPLPEMDPAWRLTQMDVDTGASKYDLFLELDERSEEVLARFHYSTDLFDACTIERMEQHFHNLLRGIVADPGRPIAELPLLGAIEVKQLVSDLNETAAEFPRDLCLHHFFEQQVASTPDAVAVISGDERISYGQLNQRAEKLAAHLRLQGVGPEVLVGLCTDRSLNLLVGILGILKAGGAYVPLDPAYPRARLNCILEDACASTLLTQQNLIEKFAGSGVNALCLDRDWPTIERAPVKSRELNVTPQNLAYVLFTSGSTGRPKGVAVEHRNAANFVQWAQTVFTREELARTLFATSMCFDLSIFEMFVPWSVGGAVIVAENIGSLPELSAAVELTLINTVPSAMTELVRSGAVPASVLTVNLAGEALPSSLVCDLHERTQVRNVYNLYGPTEATTYATYAPVGPNADVTIGKPIANTQAYILDSHRKLVPQGVPGELYLGGEGLARGYFGHPDLTAEKFISNPFSPTPNARLYKTGDLARFLPDGNIEYLGRNDHQVKIRGFRVELGEIEATLASHPGVQEAAVVAREDVPRQQRLVAYYTLWPAKLHTIGAAELRSHLSDKLPEYMVPAAYVLMERMPLTANGKLDRKVLPTPERDAYAAQAYEAPQGEIETRLAEIWTDVLRVERVGRHDNFFELGGHSLLAMQVMARIRRFFDVELPVRSIFEKPTLAGLAGELQRAQTMGFKARSPIVQHLASSATTSAHREALLSQLDELSPDEAQVLLKSVLNEKQSA